MQTRGKINNAFISRPGTYTLDPVCLLFFFSIPGKNNELEIVFESHRSSWLVLHWVDSRESSLLRRLERGREIGR